MRDVQVSFGACHRDVANRRSSSSSAGSVLATRVWKQTIFESDDKDEWKLQALCRVRSHQRHWRVAFVFILIGNECGVVDELTQPFDTLFVVIDGCVDEFLQVFQTAFGFVCAFASERDFVTGFDDRSTDDIGNRRIGIRVSIRIGQLREIV